MTNIENVELETFDSVLSVDLMYPILDDHPIKTVELNQSSVRASDGIRITYDYDRDGWSILQSSIWEWEFEEYDKLENPEDWQEVAFIKSWAREEKHD